jgi:hypothetical protein
MSEAVQRSSRGRQTKFTPENIRQIVNLVERGKAKEEIAEIIGVTPGTLQVSCSKMGISLRRPSFDMGTGPLRHRRPRWRNGAGLKMVRQDTRSEDIIEQGTEENLTDERKTAPQEACDRSSGSGLAAASFAIRMQYKGKERVTELPLDAEMIRQLALEAEFRNLKIGELIGSLIATITEHDLFQSVLEHRQTKLRLVKSDGDGLDLGGKDFLTDVPA